MRKSLIATALLATLPMIGTAQAEGPHSLSGNITLTTDYVFRGISQSQGQPALQGGFDYAHESGFYIGTWASNVGWVDDMAKKNNSMEIDLYLGYAGEAGPISYDVGAIRYFYPGSSISGVATPDSTEVYIALGWEFIELKYSHAVSKYLFGWTGTNSNSTRNSNYLELNADYEFAAGWTASAHVGRQIIKKNGGASYADWAVLYRTNAQSRVLEEMMVRAGIPYKVFGGLRFYDRKEVRDVIAYLRVIVNPADDVSLRRIINQPKRAIGDATIAELQQHASNSRRYTRGADCLWQ